MLACGSFKRRLFSPPRCWYLAAAVLWFCCAAHSYGHTWPLAVEQGISLLRIGTGSLHGTYFAFGDLLGRQFTRLSLQCEPGGHGCGKTKVFVVAQLSSGSFNNIEALVEKRIEAALIQSDIAHSAYSGLLKPADDRWRCLRSIANLYPESVHLVVRRDSGIESVQGLRKRRVALDEPGSGTLFTAQWILAEAGLQEADLKPVYIKPEFAAKQLRENKLDAFFAVMGYPSKVIAELAAQQAIRLINIPGKSFEQSHADGYFISHTVPADTYAGVAETQTVAVSAQLFVHADLDADLVYWLTQVLWSDEIGRLLSARHRLSHVRLEQALGGLALPLHKGAERYYREKGVLKEPAKTALPGCRGQ